GGALETRQQRGIAVGVAGAGPARGVQAGLAAERGHLDAGVVAQADAAARGRARRARLEQRVAGVGVGVLDDLDRLRLDVPSGHARELRGLAGVPGCEQRAQPAHRGAATAWSCAASIRSMPFAPSSSRRSSWARSNGWPSAVPCTSTSRPPLVITTLR